MLYHKSMLVVFSLLTEAVQKGACDGCSMRAMFVISCVQISQGKQWSLFYYAVCCDELLTCASLHLAHCMHSQCIFVLKGQTSHQLVNQHKTIRMHLKNVITPWHASNIVLVSVC